MKITINARGREVTVEFSDAYPADDVFASVLSVWRATEVNPDTAPAFGFMAQSRSAQVSPMAMGGCGREFIHEPRA